ncbi:MAG: transketolase [Candidatus Levybacteria bacterium]|nr:transketolase [Candidatus Levybacteria bacterium]
MQIKAKKGHLGGALSITDILVAIYYSGIFNLSHKKKKDPERDRIIFSKGHACLALYCVLADKGYFPKTELDKYGQNGTILGGHPDHFIPGVEVSSGSLGHGLGLGCGLALSAKLDEKNFLTLVILGDGECSEGSVWEAASFAAQQKLSNLIAIVDNNKVAATSFTKDFTGNSSMHMKWKSFGWNTIQIDGHNFKQIISAFKKLKQMKNSRPSIIVANTVKGKGISFMENDYHWHHGVPKGEQIQLAKKDLGLT